MWNRVPGDAAGIRLARIQNKQIEGQDKTHPSNPHPQRPASNQVPPPTHPFDYGLVKKSVH